MIILNKGDEFIWREEHFAYHITESKNMGSICNQGLKPMNGERCKAIGDDTKGIFFYDYIWSTHEWACDLFCNSSHITYDREIDVFGLELLRFDLKNRKWCLNVGGGDFYLVHKVPSERIEYLRVYDKESGESLPITSLDIFSNKDRYELMWGSLDTYKPLVRTKKMNINDLR